MADLLARGTRWEAAQIEGEWRIFERDGRLVALASAARTHVAKPHWAAEPIAEIAESFAPGDEIALVGGELVLAGGCQDALATAIHRLARTLWAHEIGARWVFVQAPLPEIAGMSPGAVAQQIAAGAVRWAPVELPLRDGYWPIGVRGSTVVLVRRNDEF